MAITQVASFQLCVASGHASVLHVKQHFKMLVCLIDDTGGFILFGVFFFFFLRKTYFTNYP